MKIRRSEEVHALGRSLELELDAVHDFLLNLSTGRGPKKSDLKGVSSFFNSVLVRAGFFYTLPVVAATGGTAAIFKGQTKLLVGMDALTAQHERVKELMADGTAANVEMKMLLPLKTYGSESKPSLVGKCVCDPILADWQGDCIIWVYRKFGTDGLPICF